MNNKNVDVLINDLINNNSKKIEELQKNNHSKAKECIKNLNQENKILEKYKNNYLKQVEELSKLQKQKNPNEETVNKINKLQTEIKQSENNVRRGYRKDTRWNKHVERVTNRYNSPVKYFVPRMIVSYIASYLSVGLGMVYAPLGIIAFGASLIYGGIAIGKFISTLRNKKRYGGPKPRQNKELFEGSNNDNALCKGKSSKNIFKRIKEAGSRLINGNYKDNSDNVILEKSNSAIELMYNLDINTASFDQLNIVKNAVSGVSNKLTGDALKRYNQIVVRIQMLEDEKNKQEVIAESVTDKPESIITEPEKLDNTTNNNTKYERHLRIERHKPNIDDYANLDKLNVVKEISNNNLSFAKAISIVRDKELHTEDEWKMAIAKLVLVFGKGNKKTKEDMTATLNDFNKTEKLLAFYGNKIKSGNATMEDKLIYQALIYHLAKYDVINNFKSDTSKDDVEDFIADEALRYAKDQEIYQKCLKKRM